MNMHVLQQRSQARLIRFEEQEVPGAELADFDPLLVNRFTRSGEGDAPIQLRRLHLLTETDRERKRGRAKKGSLSSVATIGR